MSNCMETENVLNAFKKAPIQLLNPIKIVDTLQGSIWRASTNDNHTVVVKIVNRSLHASSTAIFKNKVYHNINENIESEQTILKYLSQHDDCPESIPKFISFSETDDLLLLIQHDGGSSLFDFVVHAHKMIEAGTIDINHWQAVVKVIFKQMVECIAFIHSKNVCHNDISLENFLINDVPILVQGGDEPKIFVITDRIRISLCDFGLAELHENPECISNKHCGKNQYKSPEVYNLKPRFDGKKNDIWGCGVCLFMLSFGCPPWGVARITDELFTCVMSGHLLELLKMWDLCAYVDPFVIDLVQSIFVREEDRISVRQMNHHGLQ
eukprot:70134_1